MQGPEFSLPSSSESDSDLEGRQQKSRGLPQGRVVRIITGFSFLQQTNLSPLAFSIIAVSESEQ